MIMGENLQRIKPNDFYRRYILLQKIMKHYQFSEAKEVNQSQTSVRYQRIVGQLEQLQRVARSSNEEYRNRRLQCNLILDDLLIEYSKYEVTLQTNQNTYQNQLIQTWRKPIDEKRKREYQFEKQKSTKGKNNKNLMLLSSEILKKERIIKERISNQQQILDKSISIIQQKLKQEEQYFNSEIIRYEELVTKSKSKARKLIQKYKADLQNREYKLREQCQSLKAHLQMHFKKQMTEFEQNREHLLEILAELLQKVKIC